MGVRSQEPPQGSATAALGRSGIHKAPEPRVQAVCVRRGCALRILVVARNRRGVVEPHALGEELPMLVGLPIVRIRR